LYGAANQINEDQLGDRETTGDKLFAAAGYGALGGGLGGAVLGGGGSLASSGAKVLGGVARSGISRALSRGAEVAGEAEGAAARVASAGDEAVAKVGAAADEAVAGAKKAVTEGVEAAGEATGTKAGQEVGAAQGFLEKYTSKEAQKGLAYEQAWKAIGGGNGLQSTSYVKSAQRYLPNGTKDIGEVMMRKGIINAEDGILNAARHGTPEAMLPKLEAELQITGKQIGDMTAASPATIDGMAIGHAVNEIAGKYEQSAATRSLGTSLRRFGGDLYETLGLAERQHVPIQDLIRERKALDHMVFENASLDPALSVQVKRELRGKLEGLIIDGLDEASGKVPGEQTAAYMALKHDYTALSIATDAAEDSAARMSKAATFGLTDTLRGGGSIIKTIGSKLVRERGNAAAAVLLSRMADMGTITQAVKGVDEQIARASRGLLEAPKPHMLEAPAGTVHERAEKVMRAVADFQSNPEAHAAAITQRTDAMATNTPELAGIVSQRMTSAMAFLSSKVPVAADPDPFDPHGAPKLNDGQAAELAAYGWYVEKPSRFFEEVEHGKITYEGVEVAKLTMPRAFAQLQQETAAALAETLATPGKLVPYEQQRRLGSLLEFPATPDQRPQHMTFLQANVAPAAPAGKMTQGVASAPKRPLHIASQQSSLDRLSEKGPGRR
ncbi:MAG: hypothetical protein H0U66_02045, partial [Gemmatimonadaceae bacterium]|nr:hypothetical protein [Gemmatimonadaceae bacterium]